MAKQMRGIVGGGLARALLLAVPMNMRKILSTLSLTLACLGCGGPEEPDAERSAAVSRATPLAQLLAYEAQSELGFVADPGTSELKCTSSGTHHTCTSAYAFVCPEGWSACRLSPGVKTCCTK